MSCRQNEELEPDTTSTPKRACSSCPVGNMRRSTENAPKGVRFRYLMEGTRTRYDEHALLGVLVVYCRQDGKEHRKRAQTGALSVFDGRNRPDTTSTPYWECSSCLVGNMVLVECNQTRPMACLVAGGGTNTKGMPIWARLSCSLGCGLLVE